MEQQTNSNTNQPTLCRAGCGFYGSSSMDGMCSKCYKDALNRKMQPPPSSSSSMTPAVNITSASSSLSSGGTASNNSSFLDLSTSPIGISGSGAGGGVPFSSSVPTHLTAHLPHPSSSINLPHIAATSASGASLSSDYALSNSPSSTSLPGSFSDPSSPMNEGNKKNRCVECNKKVGLTGFECRCGGTFCPVHRYSDMHKCSFDYKQMGADEIRKNNPAVRGEKVQKL